jgi:hypothetical protein
MRPSLHLIARRVRWRSIVIEHDRAEIANVEPSAAEFAFEIVRGFVDRLSRVSPNVSRIARKKLLTVHAKMDWTLGPARRQIASFLIYKHEYS